MLVSMTSSVPERDVPIAGGRQEHRSDSVILRPLHGDSLDLVTGWLNAPDNLKWLDFGNVRRSLSRLSLSVMAGSRSHLVRLYCSEQDGRPIGVVGVNHISDPSKTGTLWAVRGDRNHGGRQITKRAVATLLHEAFMEHALNSVYTWVVETNSPSIAMVEATGFRRIGTQRACHSMDGQLFGRIHFDIVGNEINRDLVDLKIIEKTSL